MRDASHLAGEIEHVVGAARARLFFGQLCMTRGAPARAKALLERAIATFRKVSDPLGLAEGLMMRARFARVTGDAATEIGALEEAKEVVAAHHATRVLELERGRIIRDETRGVYEATRIAQEPSEPSPCL